MNKKKYILILTSLLLGSVCIYGQTTVMSFNIRYNNPDDNENWWENRKTELVDLIEIYHPDFLGIQEGLINQVEFIQDHTSNYNYIGVGRDDGIKKGEFSAIYYDSEKFELEKTHTFWLSESPEEISIGWDASMERICTYGKFVNIKTQDTIHIFNTHFDHIGNEARKMSAKLILDKIYKWKLIKSNLVVMGDLNSEPNSQAINLLDSVLDDGKKISEKFEGPTGTFNQFNHEIIPEKRIDYIFTKNLKLLKYLHINQKRKNKLCISDHLPVYIEVEYE